MTAAFVRSLIEDRRGAAVIEFAIVGPILTVMLLGVVWVGFQMQKYNALRSIAADVNRYTVVEYQKNNQIDASQIQSVAASIAVRAPYELFGDRLDVTVTQPSSSISGAKQFSLQLSYTPQDFLNYAGITPVTLTYDQNIYVPG